MTTNRWLAVMVISATFVALAWSDEKKPPLAPREHGVRAEVRGMLQFEPGLGYFVLVKPKSGDGREMRIWLRIAEDKVMVKKLQELTTKEVLAKGSLLQMPLEVRASMPPMSLYLENGLTIEPAEAK